LAKQLDLNGPVADQGSIPPPPGQQNSVQANPPPAVDNNRPKTATAEPGRPQPAGSEAKGGPSEQKQASVTSEPAKSAPPAPPPVLTKLTQEQVCKRDADWLVHVRASQSLEEVISLERELGCEKLRPQVLRLKESLGLDSPRADSPVIASAGATRASQLTPRSSVQVIVPPKAPAAEPALQESRVVTLPADTPVGDACKRDEEKLVRLRANPSLDQIERFERELRCARLRPQVARLRESVGAN
jgi:hypothetical protein